MAKSRKAEVERLFESAELLLGRTPTDPALRNLLLGLDMWPVPEFGEEDLSVYLENQDAGFCLKFDESLSVDHVVAKGQPAGTPVFVTAYFYAEGVEDYHAFTGALPAGVSFSDTVNDCQRKLGPPARESQEQAHWSVELSRVAPGAMVVDGELPGRRGIRQPFHIDDLLSGRELRPDTSATPIVSADRTA